MFFSFVFIFFFGCGFPSDSRKHQFNPELTPKDFALRKPDVCMPVFYNEAFKKKKYLELKDKICAVSMHEHPFIPWAKIKNIPQSDRPCSTVTRWKVADLEKIDRLLSGSFYLIDGSEFIYFQSSRLAQESVSLDSNILVSASLEDDFVKMDDLRIKVFEGLAEKVKLVSVSGIFNDETLKDFRFSNMPECLTTMSSSRWSKSDLLLMIEAMPRINIIKVLVGKSSDNIHFFLMKTFYNLSKHPEFIHELVPKKRMRVSDLSRELRNSKRKKLAEEKMTAQPSNNITESPEPDFFANLALESDQPIFDFVDFEPTQDDGFLSLVNYFTEIDDEEEPSSRATVA